MDPKRRVHGGCTARTKRDRPGATNDVYRILNWLTPPSTMPDIGGVHYFMYGGCEGLRFPLIHSVHLTYGITLRGFCSAR